MLPRGRLSKSSLIGAWSRLLRLLPNPRKGLVRAQRKAVLAEQRLREAIDALPEGIVFLDAEGRYVLWNQRYAEIYNVSADLFRVGAKLADTLRIGVERGHYPDAIGREEAWLEERLARLAQPGERLEQRLADGRWILIEERRTSDGGAIGIRVDITHLKKAQQEAQEARERAEAANRAKSAFIANMSHEIRTPLNGVMGLAQVLMRTGLDGPQRELVQAICSSAASLDRVLSDVLDLGRAESGRIEILCEPFDLHALLRDVCALFGATAEEKGLVFVVDAPPGGELWLNGDRDRLRQVLANLAGNAIKFTASGEVRLSAAVQPGLCRFQVADTGIGFDPAEAERLFGRFEQADGSITRAHGGSGLGLAICRELVELMDGRIEATGSPGQGAVFTVEIPLAAAEPPMRAKPAPAVADDSARRAPRILVAEDNATNRKVLQLALAGLGEIHLDMAENGQEAAILARSGAYDLILMDLHMPVMDGLTATRLIRADEVASGRPRTPLMVLSANVMAEHKAASHAAGADLHLGKPFDIADLLVAVATLLGAAQRGAQAAA